MNNKIFLNQSVSLDLPTLLDTRLLVQANSGGGKSWLLRRLLEQSQGKVQQIVIDLEGEFATLREKYDYVLAGKDGDTPAEPRSAHLLAKRLLELNVSAIIDLYELHYQDRKHFVRIFLESMINAPKNLWHPCLVVVDEAHKFCPEKEQSEASSAVIDLATLGRKRGYCAILATQRLSKLHKDAAAECNNKLIGRTTLDVDMKRASEELGFTSKEQAFALRNLAAGEFYAFGPAISAEVTKITIGSVETTHPKAGSRIYSASPIPPTERIKKILSELKDLPEAAEEEAKTIEALQQQIATLKRHLAKMPQGTQISVPSKEIDTAVQNALQKQRTEFEQRIHQLETQNASVKAIIQEAVDNLSSALPGSQNKAGEKLQPVQPVSSSPTLPPHPQVSQLIPIKQRYTTPNGAERMLRVLISRHPMKLTRLQLATLSNLSPRSGSYSRYLRLLKNQGLITIENDLISFADNGQKRPKQIPQVQTSDAIIAEWKSKLPSGAQRMFDFLVRAYPGTYTKEQIGNQVRLSPRSGSFSRYVRTLRNNGLVSIVGSKMKASETLFF